MEPTIINAITISDKLPEGKVYEFPKVDKHI